MEPGPEARDQRRWVAAGTGVAVGVLFTVLIAFGGVAAVVFEGCG